MLVVYCKYLRLFFPVLVINRGGVEDTKLEAKTKAKDTKKSEDKVKDSPTEDRPSRCQG